MFAGPPQSEPLKGGSWQSALGIRDYAGYLNVRLGGLQHPQT